MRIGLIGLGRAGGVHFDAWKHVDGSDVTAVCDPSPVARKRARDLGIRTYTNPDVMLETGDLDAVVIAAPPADHTELAQARELIAAGKIGDPVAFEVSFCSPVDMSKRWNSTRSRAGGGVIIDNGCHAFDIVSYLFGTVTWVQANLHKSGQKLAVEDSASIQVRALDGVIGRVDVSWSLSTGRDSYVTIYGSKGTIEVGWRNTRIKIGNADWEGFGSNYDKIDAHRRMLSCFVEACSGNAVPWISTVECLRTVAAVEAAYRSIHTGGWERVDMKGMRDRRGVARARATTRKRAATSVGA